MTSDVLFHVEKHIGMITLNRAPALNALTLPMIHLMHDKLQAWDNDDGIHAIVVQSNSEKAFCAGGDVRKLYDAGKNQDETQLDFFKYEYRLNYLIHQLKKPYIAWMDGLTMGGGVGISLHGSHPVASSAFVFAMPETSIGFFPDIGASYLLSRCKNHFGTYLGLTGNRLDALGAFDLGLVKAVISKDEWPCVLKQLIEADLSFNAHEQVSERLKAYALSITGNNILQEETFVETCFQYTEVERIFNALKQGQEAWHGATLKTLMQKSPLSLKVTLAQLLKVQTKTFSECLQMDYCLVQHFMQDSDFYEGVRALLIDKDKSPQWNPKNLAEVSNEKVDSYFTCLNKELAFS